ncbi:MAG: hypothetical protein Rpha_1845 [Candidatus Ruthia sp. Apha_13_S6]|nr:hypothetical protein [Candidatus Ruthia sp. Apha_13_S6]
MSPGGIIIENLDLLPLLPQTKLLILAKAMFNCVCVTGPLVVLLRRAGCFY